MDQRSRLLARLFAVCGVLLVPWIAVLIEQLHGQAGKRSFALVASWENRDVAVVEIDRELFLTLVSRAVSSLTV